MSLRHFQGHLVNSEHPEVFGITSVRDRRRCTLPELEVEMDNAIALCDQLLRELADWKRELQDEVECMSDVDTIQSTGPMKS
jgi:hypothetical protein